MVLVLHLFPTGTARSILILGLNLFYVTVVKPEQNL